jgi:hypothetical protein
MKILNKYIFGILIITFLSISACFNPFMPDTGILTINFDGYSGRYAWLHEREPSILDELEYRIQLTGNGETINLPPVQGGTSIVAPVPAGIYDLMLEAWLDDKLYASGSENNVEIIAGRTTDVTVEMNPPEPEEDKCDDCGEYSCVCEDDKCDDCGEYSCVCDAPVNPRPITGVAIVVTALIEGATSFPAVTAEMYPANSMRFEVEWDWDLDGNPFEAGEEYFVTIALTANDGFMFTGETDITINGSLFEILEIIDDGNVVILTYCVAVVPAIAGFTVNLPPGMNFTFTHGDLLTLDDLAITLVYGDGEVYTVNSDFANYGITITPPIGTLLNRSAGTDQDIIVKVGNLQPHTIGTLTVAPRQLFFHIDQQPTLTLIPFDPDYETTTTFNFTVEGLVEGETISLGIQNNNLPFEISVPAITGNVGTVTVRFMSSNTPINTNYTIRLTYGGTNYTLNNAIIPITVINGQDKDHPIPVTQANIAAFNTFANIADGLNRHYRLAGDVELPPLAAGGSNWIPIGNPNAPFTGTFDGGGFTIRHLNLSLSPVSPVSDVGLFGVIGTGAEVKNVNVEGSISGQYRVGGVVGWNNGGTVSGCSFTGTGTVTGTENVGGIVGQNAGTVRNCFVTETVNIIGANNAGGIVGWNVGGVAGQNLGGTVQNCVALNSSITRSGNGNAFGRVAGNNNGTLINNHARADMIATGVQFATGENTAAGRDGADLSEWNIGFWESLGFTDSWWTGRLPVGEVVVRQPITAVHITVIEPLPGVTDLTVTFRALPQDSVQNIVPTWNPIPGNVTNTVTITLTANPNFFFSNQTAMTINERYVNISISGNGSTAELIHTFTTTTTVTVSVDDVTTGYENLVSALDSITTAGNYVVTFFTDQELVHWTLDTSGASIVLVGSGDMRKITHIGPDEQTMFTIDANNSSLTLGNNITLQGNGDPSEFSLVQITNGTLNMQEGSKITGHVVKAIENTTVSINGDNASFVMAGGEITGNTIDELGVSIGAIDMSIANGSVTLFNGSISMSGGSISGNTFYPNPFFPPDVYVAASIAERLTLSGTANIGVLRLNAASNDAYANIAIGANWEGSVDVLHLHSDTPTMSTALDWWMDKPILTGHPAQDVDRFKMLGLLTSSRGDSIVLERFIIGNSGNNMGRLLSLNRQQGLDFLADNSAKPDMNVTPSGLQYEIIEDAVGQSPIASDTIQANIIGKLIDEMVFWDASGQNVFNNQFDFLIPGLIEGIQLMNVDSKFIFYIPWELGYGSAGHRGQDISVPPFSVLIVEVELFAIQ